jgi:hypothetical protein
MKRIVTLMLAAMLVLGSVAGASAAEGPGKGELEIRAFFGANMNPAIDIPSNSLAIMTQAKKEGIANYADFLKAHPTGK